MGLSGVSRRWSSRSSGFSCQGLLPHADSEFMTKRQTSHLGRVIFGGGKRVKIDPDFLPGLRPPKVAPRLPDGVRRHAPEISGPDIAALYKRFLASGAGKKRKRPNDRGMKL